MTDGRTQDERIESASAALRRAVAAGADDFEHPTYETLESLVDGTLPAVEREIAQGHVDICATCAEDVADMMGVRAALTPAAPAKRSSVPRIAMLTGAVAAALALTVWIARRPASPVQPEASPARASRPEPSTPVAGGARLTPEEQRAVSTAIEHRRLVVPARTRALIGREGTLLGSQDTPAQRGPVSPTGTSVLSARPAFTWGATNGATAYVVAIFDSTFREIARSPRVTATAWTPAQDLPRGRDLAWQVTAYTPAGEVTMPAPPQPEARFQILEEKSAVAMAELKVRAAADPLALGVLLARAGLVEDARAELRRAMLDPKQNAAAAALLADLARGR